MRLSSIVAKKSNLPLCLASEIMMRQMLRLNIALLSPMKNLNRKPLLMRFDYTEIFSMWVRDTYMSQIMEMDRSDWRRMCWDFFHSLSVSRSEQFPSYVTEKTSELVRNHLIVMIVQNISD